MQSESSQGLRLAFDIHEGGQLVRSETLSQASVTVGRGESSQLRLDADGVADLHAVIKVGADGKIKLTDPGDAGVTINGETVDVRMALPDGAEIGIGPFTLHFRVVAADAPATASSEASTSAPPAGPVLGLAEQAEEALQGKITGQLTTIWRKDDELKVDDVKGQRSLEIREIWGDLLLDVQYFGRDAKSIILGEHHAPQCHFFVPRERLPAETFPLVTRKNNKWVLRFTDEFRGYVEIGEVQIPLVDLIRQGDASPVSGVAGAYEMPLSEDHRFVIAIGPDILAGTFVHPPKTLPVAFQLDIPFTGMFVTLALLSIVTMVLVSRMPPPPEPDFDDMPDRFVQLLQKQPDMPKPKDEKKPLERKEKGPEGEKAKEDEGKKGKKDKKVEKAKGNQVALDKLKKDRETAENAGLLGADLDAMANLFGSGGLDSQVTGAASGLSARAIGAVGGAGGRGGRGMGPGGGGSAEGIGGLGTRGGGTGGGGYGADAGYSGKKKKANLDIGGQGAIVIGQAIDPSLIDKAIRAHTAQIRYCYSRELNKNPRLFGKVTIKFVIGAAGTVVSSSVKSSTVNNGAVENCVADRVTRIQFPKPKGGVNVTVIYPFNFNAAG